MSPNLAQYTKPTKFLGKNHTGHSSPSTDPDINYLQNNNNIISNYFDETMFNNRFSKSANLSIIHLNIRSIPLHFSKFVSFLDTIDIEFKIIALSETAINSTHISYNIPNYNMELDYRKKKRGGGVSLYIHKLLQYRLRSDLQLGGDVNSLFIEIHCSSTQIKRNIICGCVYRPPNMPLKIFNELLSSMLNKLQHQNKHVYITGDFNVNTLARVNGSLATQEFFNIFTSNFYSPLITKATRVTKHSATAIDNIFCNISDPVTNCEAGILRLSISDHYAVFCISKHMALSNKSGTITKRSFCDKNINTFKCRLQNESWNCVYDISDIQSAFTRFQGAIDQHFKAVFKMQTFAMNYKNRHPWMTEALRKQIKQKNKMHTDALHKKDEQLFIAYKSIKNRLNSLLYNTEIQYYSNQLEINKNDSAKTWKVLKNIIGKESSKSKQNITFCIDGTIVTDSTKIANGFNNFFVSIGPKLAENITCSVNPMSYVHSIENSMVLLDVPCTEVRQIISSLKNSSAGWDELPTFVAKKCVDSYIEPLTYLINKSFMGGVFPKELKLARVVPIFKAGDSALVTNYRPISVLSFFSKILEKIMYNHVLHFMDMHDIFYERQFGFREKHSTQQAIITLVDRITHSLDRGDIVISVFLDLKKAFDTVDHQILLKKLSAYGIRGNILQWFKSYLTDRSQYVIYDGKQSMTHNIKCGVPQGSILGPLLFIIYVNDVCNVSNLLLSIMYADDTAVLLSGKSLNDLLDILNTELDLLCNWLQSNTLSLDTQKTFFLLFHRTRIKDTNIVITMNGYAINRVNSLKYLGVIIDQKLNWIEHIAYVRNKISKGVGIMFKARAVLDKKSMMNLYYLYIYPYLIYCIEVWGTALKTHLDPLFLVQKKIVRIITFSQFLAHTEPIFINLSILPLHKLILNRIGIAMYKFANNLLPDVINSLYSRNSDVHSYSTRSSDLLRIPRGTLNFTNVSARVWNVLVLKMDTFRYPNLKYI